MAHFFYKHLFAVLILVFISVTGNCISKADSLAGLYHLQDNLIERHNKAFAAGEQYWFGRKLEKAIYWLRLSLDAESKPNDSNNVVNALDLLTNVYLTNSSYDSALYFSDKSFEAIKQVSNKRLLGNLYQGRARIYFSLDDRATALQLFFMADSCYMSSDEKVIRNNSIYVLLAQAYIFSDMQEFEKAKEYLETAQARAGAYGDFQTKINITESLGELMIRQKNYSNAFVYYREAMNVYASMGRQSLSLYSLLGLGDVHFGLGNTDSALYYYQKGLRYYLIDQEFYNIQSAYAKLANVFLQKKDYKAAYVYADSTLYFAKKNNDLRQQAETYSFLAQVSLLTNDFKKAFEWLQKKQVCSDSLSAKTNREKMNHLYILNKVKQKDATIDELNKNALLNNKVIQKSRLINYLLLGFTVICILFIVVYLNRQKLVKKLEQQQAIAVERERIITDLHDDVGATLSSMHIYGDLATNVWHTQPETSREMVNKITVQAKDLITSMGDIIWSMKPAYEEKYSFTARIKNYSNELLAAKNITCVFNIDESIAVHITKPELRKNLLLIVKEAMNNIAKYSGATHAEIVFKREKGHAILNIQDNGKGFDAAVIKPGYGLQNIVRRCSFLKGECIIDSGSGNGTQINCRFPIAIFSHKA